MNKIGMIRAASVSPKLKLANPEFNFKEILKFLEKAKKEKISLMVFPALCLTGASIGDLFFQENLYQAQLDALKEIVDESKDYEGALVLGFYLKQGANLINCSAFIQKGHIAGIVPCKLPSTDLDGKNRFKESFIPTDKVKLFAKDIDFGSLVFHDTHNDITIGIEENRGCQNTEAQIIANPTIALELITSKETRRQSLKVKSYESINSQIFATSGPTESSSAGVYSGHIIIAEAGNILAEDSELSFESKIVVSEIDFFSLDYKRGCQNFNNFLEMRKINIEPLTLVENQPVYRKYSTTPFVPEDPSEADANCREAFSIQATALARRLSHTGSAKAVLGVSGGLDSTMALLVTAKAMDILGKPHKDIIGVTMPGFGTTDRTYDNAIAMMEALDVEIREISIKDAVLLHFKDIGHDPEIKNVVYENVQARERTQILMNIANMENCIQIGTGDLSEAALGWSTYNGDHMSMYSVNAGMPKTFMRRTIEWYAQEQIRENSNIKLAQVLKKVLTTPVSPELLPPDDDGQIAQMTEDTVGPYILHDFFLYHTIRRGTPPVMLLAIARKTFDKLYDEKTINKWLKVFYRRFFIHQFKRSCVPDSPKIGSVSLFSRTDWLMASDVGSNLWIDSLP